MKLIIENNIIKVNNSHTILQVINIIIYINTDGTSAWDLSIDRSYLKNFLNVNSF